MTCSSACTRSGRQATTTSDRRSANAGTAQSVAHKGLPRSSPRPRRVARRARPGPCRDGRSTSTTSASRPLKVPAIAGSSRARRYMAATSCARASSWSSWPVIRADPCCPSGSGGNGSRKSRRRRGSAVMCLEGAPRDPAGDCQEWSAGGTRRSLLVVGVAQPAGMEAQLHRLGGQLQRGSQALLEPGHLTRVSGRRTRSRTGPRRGDRGRRRRRPPRRRRSRRNR